jgi:hypothetical protein
MQRYTLLFIFLNIGWFFYFFVSFKYLTQRKQIINRVRDIFGESLYFRRKIKQIWALPLKGALPSPLHPQLMLWFTYYKGTFSTFVFASQNRSFMLRSVLRTLRPYRQLTHPPTPLPQ